MAPAPKTPPTNGPVLRWARITRGLSAEIAAQRLGITTVDLRNMETGDDQPSVGLLSQMARVYRRPQGVLLLPFAPPTDPLPTDFRTVGGVGSALGEETLRAIFEARHVQHFVSELVEIEPELIRASNLPEYSVGDSPEAAGEHERIRLDVSQAAVLGAGPGRRTFYGWRTRLQDLGILVLLKSFPVQDCRGLSLTGDNLVPAIMVTSEDSNNGLTFSLVHEYAHLLLRQPGSCIPGSYRSENVPAEPWCNRFAAAFLSPETDLLSEVRMSVGDKPDQSWTIYDIHNVARRFRMSDFAMALRLKSVGITSTFDRIRDDLYAGDYKPQTSGGGGGETRTETRVRENGTAAITTIVDAVNMDVVEAGEACEMLGLDTSRLAELDLIARKQKRDQSFMA